MTEYTPRLFHSDAEIEHIGESLVARTLPRSEWTHEAHLAATTYLLLKRPDIDLDKQLPGIIRAYNESVGGVNSDSEGYHETITRVYLHGVRLFLSEVKGTVPGWTVKGTVHLGTGPRGTGKGTVPEGTVPAAALGTVPSKPLHRLVNELLLSPMGQRDWPLRFYSPELLFSVEARRRFVEPDLRALP